MKQKLRKHCLAWKGIKMLKEVAKTKIIGLKNTHIQSLRLKGITPKPFIIKNLALKEVTFYRVKS